MIVGKCSICKHFVLIVKIMPEPANRISTGMPHTMFSFIHSNISILTCSFSILYKRVCLYVIFSGNLYSVILLFMTVGMRYTPICIYCIGAGVFVFALQKNYKKQ